MQREANGRTFTSVKKLSDEERLEEVVRMLGGVKIAEKTKRRAEEMVKMQGSGH